MPILFPTSRRIALIGLLLLCLAVLADWTARIELARAVAASPSDGARIVASVAAADD